MYLKNNYFKKRYNIFLTIFLVGILSRSIVAYFYGDRFLENEWAILVENLYKHNHFSLIRFDELFLPNLWMPPIYGYFVYIHALIFGYNENLANFVNFTQIILSSLTPIIFLQIISNFFSERLSLFGAYIFSLFPLIVYSSSQISSVTIYLFLFLSFIYLIINLSNKNSLKTYLLIGILSGILLLTRRDFILILIFSLLYLFFFLKIDLKKIACIFLVSLLTISPYLIRNFLAFDRIIIHSGLGYNTWKAYNPNAKVEGYYKPSKELKIKLNKINKDIYYRINEDKVYLNQAKTYILEDPHKYIKLFFKRLFSFYFYDYESSQKNYFSAFHLVPNLMIATLSIAGLLFFKRKADLKYFYLILVMIIILIVYSSFALLPRYKIYLLPFQILLCLNILEYLYSKFIKKN